MADIDYITVAEGPMCPSATLGVLLDWLDDELTIANLDLVGSPAVKVGDALMIDEEILVILTVVVEAVSFTIGRGCADTVPQPHSVGAPIWFFEDYVGTDFKEYASGVIIGVKLLPFTTSGGTLPIGNSPPTTLPFDGRFIRPYPPAKLTVNDLPWHGIFSLDSLNEEMIIEWVHRNRVLQGDVLIDHMAFTVTPEANQATSIYIYNAADDTLLRAFATSFFSFTYSRSQATFDFGLGGIFDPPDQLGYMIVRSERDGYQSKYGYRIDFSLVPGDTVEQPFGLGYRLGEFLGGYPAGTGLVGLSGARFVAFVDGKLIYSRPTDPTYDIYTSIDDGKNFTLEVTGSDAIGAYSGFARWSAAIGTQYIAIGRNRFADDTYGIYDGTSDVTTPPNYTDKGPYTDLAEALHVGSLFQYGSYYYVVARYASDNNSNTNLHNFYLFRATTDLEFVLQGQMLQHPSDPYTLGPGDRGNWMSEWFTPNGSSPGIYESRCELSRGFNGRWFLANATQLYYTDVATGLTGWKRCNIMPPWGFPVNTRFLHCLFKGTNGQILAVHPSEVMVALNWSTDNGVTWTQQLRNTTGFDTYDVFYPLPTYFNSKFMVWSYRPEREFEVKNFEGETAAKPFPAVALSPVTGIEPEDDPHWQYYDTKTLTTILGRDHFDRMVYTENGIDFHYCGVNSYGAVLLMNFTTDESDESGTHVPVAWNDATVAGGVIQFDGDGYLRVDQDHDSLNFNAQDFTFEVFAKIDTQTGVPVPDQWIVVYGDTPSERTSSALSIQAFGNAVDDDEISLRIKVQTRDDDGVITVHTLTSGGLAPTDILYHIVVQRRVDKIEFFFEGGLIDITTIADESHLFGRVTGARESVFFGGGPEVGGTGTGTDYPMTGSISAVRVTRGEAVYPLAGFSVPSLPLT